MSAQQSIIGQKSVLEQGKQRMWKAERGWATVRTWVGSKAACNAYLVTVQSSGATEIDCSEDGPTSTITATYPDAQDSSLSALQSTQNITWELLGNDLEKNLKTFYTIFNQATGTAAQRQDLNAAEKAIKEATAINAGWYAGAQTYFKLASQGIESYLLTQYVLHKSIKVGGDGVVAASLANVNKVEAPSGVPTILFSVPTDDGQGTLEWLKKAPRVLYLGRGKYSIDQQWWGAARWSNELYGGTGSP